MMRKECKFFRCSVCGNIIEVVHNGGGPLTCCGKPMELLKANTTEASTEKHIPVACKDNNKLFIKIGSAEHPMTEEHHIEWIYLLSEGKGQMIELAPGDKPEVHFGIGHRKMLTVYAYCNLHGLWSLDVSNL